MALRIFCFCLAICVPLTAQTDSAPWDILGSQTHVLPFNQAGLFGRKLLPNGDVLLSGSSCNATAIEFTASYGNTSLCGLVVLRVNAAGVNVFALRLGGVFVAYLLQTDADGDVLIGGQAESSVFQPTPGAYLATAPSAAVSANYSANFACKLRATDGTPRFCTFLDDTATLLTLDASGDLFFVTSAGSSQSLVELNPAGVKMVGPVTTGGTVNSIVPNVDGTLYLAGRTQSPLFPFSSAPGIPPSSTRPAAYYGQFDLSTGFRFAQAFGPDASFTIALNPAAGPILVGNLGSGFAVRQYAADGTTIVYDDSFPAVSSGTLSTVDDGVVLAGFSSSAALPLYRNVHVCGQILTPGSVNNAMMIRLDRAGAVVQSTWLGSASFGSLVNVGAHWSALGSITGEAGAYAPNSYIQVLTVGPNPAVPSTTIGCMVNLAGASTAASPGLLVSLSVENDAAVGPVSAQPTSSGRFPTSLAGIAVTFNGVPAPLFALNGQELNGAVPFSVAGQSTVQMCLASSVLTPSCTAIQVQPFAPTVLAVANEDGSINSTANPALPGSIVTFYAIGLGSLSPAVPDGTIVGLPLPGLAAQVAVEYGSTTPVFPGQLPPQPTLAQVTYAGPAPGEVAGVYQINALIPSGVSGAAAVVVGPVGAIVPSGSATVMIGAPR